VKKASDRGSNSHRAAFVVSDPVDVSVKIKLNTNEGEAIRAFYLPDATSIPASGEGFVGDVRQGAIFSTCIVVPLMSEEADRCGW